MSKAAAVDFTRLTTKFGLSKSALSGISAFRKRNEDARRTLQTLKSQKTDVDFAHYKNVLKNQQVVSQLEKTYSSYQPVDYDLQAQLKTIDAFEQKATSSAEQTSSKIGEELKQLNSTLSDIEDARSFEDLTLNDIAKARPQIPQTVDSMVSQGKWSVPGYTEKFGNISAM